MYNFICFLSVNDKLLLLLFIVYNTVIFFVSLLYPNKDIHLTLAHSKGQGHTHFDFEYLKNDDK